MFRAVYSIKFVQNPSPFLRYRDLDLSPIRFGSSSFKQALARHAVNHSHCAVMSNPHFFGKFAHGYPIPIGESFDGEKDLILLRRDPVLEGSVFAKP